MKLIGRKTSVGAVVAAALMLPWIGMVVPASAHHAFAAEYDAKKHVILKGTVTKMEWINPHAWIHIEVKRPDGNLEEWMIEFGTPNTLLRRGFTGDSPHCGLRYFPAEVSGDISRSRAAWMALRLGKVRTSHWLCRCSCVLWK